MKKLLLLALLLPISLWAQKEEHKAIKAVIESAYLEGITNEGNAEKIDAGFHPGFNILGYNTDNGRIWEYPIYYWKQSALTRANDPEQADREPVRFEYPYIDVTGHVGMAKIDYFRGDKLLYTDYLSLYKVEGEWKIVSKVFYPHPDEDSEE
ncbi:nuclear transport factor 2 family protein [Cryomorphaceae bacterium]|nr:nuclear transport factor 2 family protein [Cryomorphaceae bacterium]